MLKKWCALLLVAIFTLNGCMQNTNLIEVDSFIENLEIEDELSEGSLEIGGIESQDDIASEDDDIEHLYAESIIGDRSIEDTFSSLSDQNLLQYIEDTTYIKLIETFYHEDYFIENVEAIYISNEYIEELNYNSQGNIYFGYTLAEIYDQFDSIEFIFTTNEAGETEVQAFEAYDDTYDKVIANVAQGTGVILVCVTIIVVTKGTVAVPAIKSIFAFGAKKGITDATKKIISATVVEAINAIKTDDVSEIPQIEVLEDSTGFQWGAMIGTLTGE